MMAMRRGSAPSSEGSAVDVRISVYLSMHLARMVWVYSEESVTAKREPAPRA
jgi:hypothetical protein